MNSRREHIVTLLIDVLTINLAYLAYYFFRVRSGWIPYSIEPDLLLPMVFVCMYWLIWFGIFGLYRSWYEQSRIDEMLTIVRVTILGALILFFLIFLDDTSVPTSSDIPRFTLSIRSVTSRMTMQCLPNDGASS